MGWVASFAGGSGPGSRTIRVQGAAATAATGTGGGGITARSPPRRHAAVRLRDRLGVERAGGSAQSGDGDGDGEGARQEEQQHLPVRRDALIHGPPTL